MRIETEIETVSVEIEDGEYDVAQKTVDVAEKLIKVRKDNVGQPQYKLWLAELEVLLGKDTCKKLFASGKNENLDRVERIYRGVIKAFNYNSDTLENEQMEDKIQTVNQQIKPVTELLKQANAMSSGENKKVIHRS